MRLYSFAYCSPPHWTLLFDLFLVFVEFFLLLFYFTLFLLTYTKFQFVLSGYKVACSWITSIAYRVKSQTNEKNLANAFSFPSNITCTLYVYLYTLSNTTGDWFILRVFALLWLCCYHTRVNSFFLHLLRMYRPSASAAAHVDVLTLFLLLVLCYDGNNSIHAAHNFLPNRIQCVHITPKRFDPSKSNCQFGRFCGVHAQMLCSVYTHTYSCNS